MPGFPRAALLATVAAAALALPAPEAPAARFTAHLDALAEEVADRDAALAGDLTPEQKKEKKAYAKVLAALGGDTASLLEELKLAGKVAKTLEKALPEDEEIADLLADATGALEDEAGVLLEDLEGEVDGEPDSKGKTKADRALDAAILLFESSGFEELFSLRMKFLLKAVQKTTPVQKFLTGGGGGGGGGGGAGCVFGARTLGAGESATASWETGSFAAGAVAEQILDNGSGYVKKWARFTSCGPSLTRQFAVYFDFTPVVGTPYPYDTVTSSGVYYGEAVGDGFLATTSGYGTLTFTEVNDGTGTYAGTFTFTGGGKVVTDGAFRIVGLK